MITRRRGLYWGVVVVGGAGVLIVAMALSSSLAPTTAARSAQEVHVPLAGIVAGALNEVTWRGTNVVILAAETPRAFLLPFDAASGRYMLPDPTWDRSFSLCERMEFDGNVLSCKDPGFVGSDMAWYADGRNVGGYIAPLKSPPYTLQSGDLIIGRSHER